MEEIIRNAVYCKVCDTLIESTHRHDFKYCNCPEGSKTRVAVDGGHVYLKRLLGPLAQYKELSETE
jgi:hypothetical protein